MIARDLLSAYIFSFFQLSIREKRSGKKSIPILVIVHQLVFHFLCNIAVTLQPKFGGFQTKAVDL